MTFQSKIPDPEFLGELPETQIQNLTQTQDDCFDLSDDVEADMLNVLSGDSDSGNDNDNDNDNIASPKRNHDGNGNGNVNGNGSATDDTSTPPVVSPKPSKTTANVKSETEIDIENESEEESKPSASKAVAVTPNAKGTIKSSEDTSAATDTDKAQVNKGASVADATGEDQDSEDQDTEDHDSEDQDSEDQDSEGQDTENESSTRRPSRRAKSEAATKIRKHNENKASARRLSRRAKSRAATKIRKGCSEDSESEHENKSGKENNDSDHQPVNESSEEEASFKSESEEEDQSEDAGSVHSEDGGSVESSEDLDGVSATATKTTKTMAVRRNSISRPSRRAKSAAVQKMADANGDSGSNEEDEVEEVEEVEVIEGDAAEPNTTTDEEMTDSSPLPSTSNGEDNSDGSDSNGNDDDDAEGDDAEVKVKAEAETEEDGAASKQRVKTEDSLKTEKGSLHGTKKRKTPPKLKIKSEGGASVGVKKEEGDDDYAPPKKKHQRQRVSDAVVNDAADKMLVVLIKNYKDDIKEVPLDVLASSITSKKGKPYKNYRSDAIQDGLKLLRAQNKVEKIRPGSKVGNVGAARLLPLEIEKIPKEQISKDPAKVLEQRYKQFLERLASTKKGGKGASILKASKIIWKKLEDGKAYSRKELVAFTAYSDTNSSGFEAIVKVLNEMNFVEGKGKMAFTSKVFPHGRPE